MPPAQRLQQRNPWRFWNIALGVAGLVPDVQSEPDSLLRRADAALYEAKRAGRNKVATDAGVPAG